jgi:death on curing protein
VAQQRALELGDRELAPPMPLERCNRNTLELALAKPQAAFEGVERYPSLAAKAAALLYGLAKSQACPDGNKRIALIVVIAFLRINGFDLRVQRQEMAETILRAAESRTEEHDVTIQELTEWFEARIDREENV